MRINMLLKAPHHEPCPRANKTLVKQKNRLTVTCTSRFECKDEPCIKDLAMKIFQPNRLDRIEAKELFDLVNL